MNVGCQDQAEIDDIKCGKIKKVRALEELNI